jgi:phage gp36-like protein
MPYVTKNDMLAVIPTEILTAAVDDQNMGDDTENVWDIIAAAAARRIDSILGSRYDVPFADPAPAIVREAAVTFAAFMLFARRQAGDNNPWAKAADAIAARLQDIANGISDISVDDSESAPYAITEPSKTYNDGRLMI